MYLKVTSAGDGRRAPAPSATILLFAPPRQQDAGATVAVAGPVSLSAMVVPFVAAAAAAAGRRHRFTPQDRAALIALGYALAGWTVAFETDGQGMQWAALCPRDRDGADARYLVGRDGSALVLLGAVSGQVLGRYATGAALAQDVRHWEAVPECGQQRDGAGLGAQSHRPARHRFP